MNKTELEKQLATDLDISQAAAKDVLNAVLDEISHGLVKGESITLPGFGSFVVSERQAREGRNPRTGETMQIPASKSVRFRPGKTLKDQLANTVVETA